MNPPLPPSALQAQTILAALEAERAAATRPKSFKVLTARGEGALVLLEVDPLKRAGAIDESLEGARALWGEDLSVGRGEVIVVDPDRGELALRFVQGPLPVPDQIVHLFAQDFLTPLIELWREPRASGRALAVAKRSGETPTLPEKPLKPTFGALRKKQAEAVQAALYPGALIVGPPGTGKTFTLGAAIANLLARAKNARVLLLGPTNMAVDTALVAADDWLSRNGRDDLRGHMKRLGSRFDTRRYADREHLLAPGLYQASVELALLELEEPAKANIERYVAWKESVERARKALRSDTELVASGARLVAMTAASLFIHQEAMQAAGPWHFAVCDEASQLMLPAALMAAGFAAYSTFAGDPNQLAPIVQASEPWVAASLGKSAFDALPQAKTVRLDEQSRMSVGICDVVSTTFYDNGLRVCSTAARDRTWKAERSPWFLNGREVPRVMFDERAGPSTWSSKYNGLIRFGSAQIVEALVAELLGSYVEAEELLVLTPFRAQRALIRTMLRRDSARQIRVSTVHRSQGSESKIVIFDPVDAGGSFLNSQSGRRLINVAASRAQAHLMIIVNDDDLKNPWIRSMKSRARALWHRAGSYAEPLQVKLRSY